MKGKKKYWCLNALPMLFLPMSILAVIILIHVGGSFSSEFWLGFLQYHLVYWLVLFYPAYYVFCWRKSLRMTDEQVQNLVTKMTVVGSILTLWAGGTIYMIDAALKTSVLR